MIPALHIRPLRFLPLLLFVGCSPAPDGDASPEAAADDSALMASDPGIAAQRPAPDELPANAQIVPVADGGYMTPYKAEIPGFGVTYRMTPIPAGTFTMGSAPDEPGREDDEGPRVEVAVEPFWMSTHEVTWAQYHAFMRLYEPVRQIQQDRPADEWPVPEHQRADAVTIPSRLYNPGRHYSYGGDAEHPAVTITQYAARQYTKFLSKLTGRFYRLPTEAEWEYAARAGAATAWSFGDDIDELPAYARFFDEDAADEGPLHVGSLKPNPWGLYDMHGNVAELVIDQYEEDRYARLAADAPARATEAIAWPMRTYPIVVRGGSWDHNARQTRSAYRWHTSDPDWKNLDAASPRSTHWFYGSPHPQTTGFRIVRPLQAPDEATQHRFWGSREQDLPPELWRDFQIHLSDFGGAIGIIDDNLLDQLSDSPDETGQPQEPLH